MSLDLEALEAAKARIEREAARRAWVKGDLSYKLDATQRQIRAKRDAAWKPAAPVKPGEVLSPEERARRADVPVSFFELCARGLGKSFELVVLAIETALRTKNGRVLYVAPLREDAEKIATDLAEIFILSDCPDECRPLWRSGDGEYVFPNGAVIRFRGVNNDSVERLRGFGYHLVILDECAAMDRLRYVFGVVRPLAQRMKGKVILPTTPAENPGHESKQICDEHAERGAYIEFTLLDNARLSWDEKATILLNEGESVEDVPAILDGTSEPKKPNTRREYFCKWITDGSMSVLPEFTTDAQMEIVRALPATYRGKRAMPPKGRGPWAPIEPRPRYFDKYTVMDPGFVDRLGLLFMHYDFQRGKIVIEAEALLPRANTALVAENIEAIERELWGRARDVGGGKLFRWSDIEPRLQADLRAEHNLYFQSVERMGSEVAMNRVRTTIQFREIEIHDRCVNLVRQMEGAIWNASKKDLARDEQSGHYDLVAALKYACRHVDRRRNPFPADYNARQGFGTSASVHEAPVATGLLPQTGFGQRLAKWQMRRTR